MVQDRVTDGYRIAELLASEVDGRRRGPLGDLVVANADRSVSGSQAGERAYDVRLLAGDRDPRREPTTEDAGTLVARAFVHVEGARVEVLAGAGAAADAARDGDLVVDSASSDGAVTIRVEYGAQSKRAADALAAASAAIDPAVEGEDA